MITRIKTITALLMAGLLACPAGVSAADFTPEVEKPVHESVAIRKETQRERERWQAEKEEKVAAYEALEARRADLMATRKAVQKQLARQHTSNRELAAQLVKLDSISKDIEPFLQETYARLVELLEREPALLPEERSRRLERLDTLLQDPTVDISEKYRKTMEALFIEAEYGNTVDVYQQTIRIADQPLTVTILRLGRLALFFQGMDAKTCGYYDRASGKWHFLADKYNKAIETAVEIVRKQRPAQMVALPIGRMVAK
jgi:septal ring factor EnvC (AmiA/AmiB activator)